MEVQKIEVIVRVTDSKGDVKDHVVNPEEAFLARLKWSIQDGKDPEDVLAFLADEGANSGMTTNPLGWKNRVDGKFQLPKR